MEELLQKSLDLLPERNESHVSRNLSQIAEQADSLANQYSFPGAFDATKAFAVNTIVNFS